MFSVLILTFNEELNIAACIESVRWADDVVVLDSFSTDRTVEICRELGVRVFQRTFDDFGSQRNFAIDEIQFSHPWVFHLDADERFNDDLRQECERAIGLDERSAYFVPNRIFFLGKWIKHCTQYPYPQVRLIKLGEVRFAKSGHGQREEAAKRGLGYIQIPYDHFNFSHGVEDWIAKHNRYSGKEAEGLSDLRLEPVKNVFSKDPIQRKRALKSYFARMPGRPLLKFCYLYFWKRGFLDGYPGLVYCRLQMLYESMISLKTVEKKWIQKREIPD